MLTLFEIHSPEQWKPWQGEMNQLVHQLAVNGDAIVSGLIELDAPKIYAHVEQLAADDNAKVALIMDVDEDKQTTTLRGFIAVNQEDERVHCAYLSTSSKLKAKDFHKICNDFVDDAGREWGKKYKTFFSMRAAEMDIKERGATTRKVKHFGMKPVIVIYGGLVGEKVVK